jgi:hypothetical protein
MSDLDDLATAQRKLQDSMTALTAEADRYADNLKGAIEAHHDAVGGLLETTHRVVMGMYGKMEAMQAQHMREIEAWARRGGQLETMRGQVEKLKVRSLPTKTNKRRRRR